MKVLLLESLKSGHKSFVVSPDGKLPKSVQVPHATQALVDMEDFSANTKNREAAIARAAFYIGIRRAGRIATKLRPAH